VRTVSAECPNGTKHSAVMHFTSCFQSFGRGNRLTMEMAKSDQVCQPCWLLSDRVALSVGMLCAERKHLLSVSGTRFEASSKMRPHVSYMPLLGGS
jgi:hypothetical protein